MTLMRYSRRLTFPVVIGITCASFALHVLAHSSPRGTFAFFMLPTRAWELGVGAIIALAPRASESDGASSNDEHARGRARFRLIACALLSSRDDRPPIYPASTHRAGTALLVSIGQYRHNPVSRVLGSAPLVWIGLISYSLYLWHWPVIVFSKYFLVRELRPLEVAAAGVFMFAAAAVLLAVRRAALPAARIPGAEAVHRAPLAVTACAGRIRPSCSSSPADCPARLSAEAAAHQRGR